LALIVWAIVSSCLKTMLLIFTGILTYKTIQTLAHNDAVIIVAHYLISLYLQG
jgi:hypothetical protein